MLYNELHLVLMPDIARFRYSIRLIPLLKSRLCLDPFLATRSLMYPWTIERNSSLYLVAPSCIIEHALLVFMVYKNVSVWYL